MEFDLQRFYNINRRALMWVAFFGILILLRHFFALMFLTFIFGFVMRKVATFLTTNTRLPHTPAVALPYLGAISLLALLVWYAVPRVVSEGAKFSGQVPYLLEELAQKTKIAAHNYEMEEVVARYVNRPDPTPASRPAESPTPGSASLTSQPAAETIRVEDMVHKMRSALAGLLRGFVGGDKEADLEEVLFKLSGRIVGGTVHFLLALLLSFLILLDYDRIAAEISNWRSSPVGAFFYKAAASVVDFSRVVGSAFQCQLVIALLNASITSVGLFALEIRPLMLLTTIVFVFGLIPVLGVFISSVPIILIAFNDGGPTRAFLALALIVVVHMLEAYVFNPRIYAARFHLNPVIVLIILLVAHEVFGVWGMLLGIPVTHYVLNVAQMPATPRKKRKRKRRRRGASAGPAADAG